MPSTPVRGWVSRCDDLSSGRIGTMGSRPHREGRSRSRPSPPPSPRRWTSRFLPIWSGCWPRCSAAPVTAVAAAIRELRTEWLVRLPEVASPRLRRAVLGAWLDDQATKEMIADARGDGVIGRPAHCDRHRRREGPRPSGTPLVCLATAHPAKFPEAVAAATGMEPALPAELAGTRPERAVDLSRRFGSGPQLHVGGHGANGARSAAWQADAAVYNDHRSVDPVFNLRRG